MITPVGANAQMTAAMVRAGTSAYQNTEFHLEDDEPIRMALVPQAALDNSLNEETLTGEFSARQYRLLQLAKLALVQLAPKLPKDLKLPLFLAGPEQLLEGDQPITKPFLENLATQTQVNLDMATSRIVSTGRAGGLAAINLAFRLFAGSDDQFVLVGGVDTYHDSDILEYLLRNERLLAGENMNGFIPGEGAAFILLTRHNVALQQNNHKTVGLYEAGLDMEKGYRGSAEVYRGDGLAGAFSAALANAHAGKIKTLCSSMNGEHFFAKEHGVALIRNSEHLEENMKVEHPADCFGDLGAAFGPVAVGMSAVNLLNQNTASPCMVCCSSDKESRGAVVLHV